MAGPASGVFNVEAEPGNGLTASELTSRPMAEWDGIIAGRTPDNVDTFSRNLRNTFEQSFDRLMDRRVVFGLENEIDRIRAGVKYPRGPEDFSDNPEIQQRIGEIFEKGAADPNYGGEQLRQDLEAARGDINQRIESVIQGVSANQPEPAAPAATSPALDTKGWQQGPGISV